MKRKNNQLGVYLHAYAIEIPAIISVMATTALLTFYLLLHLRI